MPLGGQMVWVGCVGPRGMEERVREDKLISSKPLVILILVKKNKLPYNYMLC